jgi:iron complex outermembrane receptor protein
LVSIQGLGLSIGTSPTGRYALSGIPAGQYVLQFRMIGYAPREVAVAVTAGTSATVDAVLDPRPIELSTVVVEGASRAPDRMIDAPAAVDVVRPAAGDIGSIAGQVPLAMARMPGLDVVQNGINDFNINARGFNKQLNSRVLVLQDGRDLASLYVIRENWGALAEPLEDMGRIEVIRGPGSALYGPNAVNGVINITTPAARDIVGTKFTVGSGELGTLRADVRQAGVWRHGRLGYRMNLGYRQSADWTLSRTAYDSLDWAREYAPATSKPVDNARDSIPLIGQTKDPVTGVALGVPEPLVAVYGSARLDYYGRKGSMVTLEGGTAQEENAVSIAGTGRTQGPKIERPWVRLAWDGSASALSAWYAHWDSPEGSVRLANAAPSRQTETAFHLEGRTSRTFHGNTGRVVTGASIQDNWVDTYGSLPVAQDDRHRQYYGAFGQLEYLVGRVRMIGALRWDDSDIYTTQLSPKGALVYTPTPNHALHVSVNRGFGTQSLANLYQYSNQGVRNLLGVEQTVRADPAVGPALAGVATGTLFGNSARVPLRQIGNPDLVPQSMMSYEVGYKSQLGSRAFITLDTYFAHITNFISTALPGVNPKYSHWTAPDAVAPAERDAVERAVRNAYNAAYPLAQNGLTNVDGDTTAIVTSYVNVGTVTQWGVELGGSVSLTRALTLSVSYTWYQYAIQDTTAENVLAPNTPEHKGTVALEYAGRHGITFGVDARIVEQYYWYSGAFNGYVPASQTVNLHAGWRLNPHLRVYANATNLLDQQRFHMYGGSVNGRRVLAGMTSTL